MAASLNLPARFREFVLIHKLIASGDRIVVAVSGGVDSVVLLHLLAGERTRLELELLVAHFNHHLRGDEADADEAFVSQLASRHGMLFEAGEGRVEAFAASQGIGLEAAARSLRYSFLETARSSRSFTRIATGHNADDNAETVLLHLFRGSGVRGMAGIPVSRDNGRIIRPLLFATRDEIASFAAAAKLEHREDSSNATDAHARNIIRHHVLPVVRSEIQPDVARTVLRTSALFRELDDYVTLAARTGLDQVVMRRTGEEVQLSLSLLSHFPDAVQSALLAEAAAILTGGRPGFRDTEKLLRLRTAKVGATTGLGQKWEASRMHDALRIGTRTRRVPFTMAVQLETPCSVAGGSFSCGIVERAVFDAVPRPAGEFVDAERTGRSGLILRSWQRGDRFVPLGMSNQKKLSDFFVDEGIPAHEKHRYPVLTTAAREIIWVCGLRIDDRFKITSHTREVLRLQFHQENESTHGEHTHRKR